MRFLQFQRQKAMEERAAKRPPRPMPIPKKKKTVRQLSPIYRETDGMTGMTETLSNQTRNRSLEKSRYLTEADLPELNKKT